MDNPLTGEIKEAIEGDIAVNGHTSYGLRTLTRDQLALSVGDILPPSRNYIEDRATDESLAGSSAIGLDTYAGEVDKDDVAKAITLAARYSGNVVAIVAGRFAGNGQDDGEVLIADARIVAAYPK